MAVNEAQKAYYRQAVAEGVDPSVMRAELKKLATPEVGNISETVAQIQPSQEDLAYRDESTKRLDQLNEMLAMRPTEGMSTTEKYLAGTGKNLTEVGRGAQQLYDLSPVGDKDRLARSYEAQAEANRLDAPLMNTTAGFAGNAIGATPALLGGGMVLSRGLPAATGALGTLATGATYGAATGAAIPLTAEEEAANMRTLNALLGGAIGTGAAALPVVASAVRKGVQSSKRMLPNEALEKFSSKVGGGKDSTVAKQDFKDAVEAAYQAKAKEFKDLYSKVETNPDLPTIPLRGNERAAKILSELEAEISDLKAPALAKLRSALSPEPSVIIGAPAPTKQASFALLRQSQRDLKLLERSLKQNPANDAKVRELKALRGQIEDEIERAAAKNPDLKSAAEAARGIDSRYKQEVAPFTSRRTELGKYRGAGLGDYPGNKTNLFLGDESGPAITDLLSRVPAAKDPARAILASGWTSGGTPGKHATKLVGNEQTKALLSQSERDYAKMLADALRSGSSRPDAYGGIVRGIGRIPGLGGRAQRTIEGVPEYLAAPSKVGKRRLAEALAWAGGVPITAQVAASPLFTEE